MRYAKENYMKILSGMGFTDLEIESRMKSSNIIKILLFTIFEENYIKILNRMGFTEAQIKKRMKKRVILTIFMLTIFILLFVLLNNWILLTLLLIMPFLAFKNDYSKAKKDFESFSFNQDIQFSKFMRLIVPYLKQDSGNASLYTVFSKLIPRFEGEFQNSLFRLMNEMVVHPNDIKPFIDFAERSSNKDVNINFMMSLFDFQNASNEVSVIEDLSEIANQELLKRTKNIVDAKGKKVSAIPFVMSFSISIILVSYLISLIIYNVKQTGILSSVN